jgi:murein DD-endopeptidase MepM/ murein hydrolase activator NlpD
VTFAGKVAGKPVVTITHHDGLRSSLEPVAAIVAVGSTVQPGQIIGTLSEWPAETGSNSTHCPGTTCVHWGVRRECDTYLDPLWLVGLAPPIVLMPLDGRN